MMADTTTTDGPTTVASTEATLFLPQGQTDALPGLLARIDGALLGGAGGFHRITARPDAFSLFARDGRRVLVALCPEPVDTSDLTALAADRASVARLRDHAAAVVVSVRPHPGDAARRQPGGSSDDPAGERLCAEVVARILPASGADLVHWAVSGRLQRAEELSETAGVLHVRRPTTRTPRPVMIALDAHAMPSDVIAHPVSRIGRPAGQVPQPRRPAELRMAAVRAAAPAPDTAPGRTGATAQLPARVPPQPGVSDTALDRGRRQAEAVFPPLAPAEGDGSHDDLVKTRFAIYGAPGPQFGDRDAPPVQRLSVYALNMSLIVAAAPVGAAVLVVNIVFGENMRLTSHALALTGVSIGTDLPARALEFLSGLI